MARGSTSVSPVDLLSMRTGHFAMASGHHGNLWLDLDLLFTRPAILQSMVRDLGERLRRHGAEAVCGPASGGALLAYAIAQAFDLESFSAARSLAADGSWSYTVPSSLRTRIFGKRTAIVDDVINAGSAVRSTCEDLRRHGGVCVAIGALVTLGSSPARSAAELELPLELLAHLPNELWAPLECPLCGRGIPLE